MPSFETGVKQVHLVGTDGQVPFEMQSQGTPQTKEGTALNVNTGATTTILSVPVTVFNTAGVIINPSASHTYTLNVYASPDGTIKADKVHTSNATGGARSPIMDCPAEYLVIEVNNADTVNRTYDVWVRKMNK